MNYLKNFFYAALVLSLGVGIITPTANAEALVSTISHGSIQSAQKVQTKDIPALFQSVYGRVPTEAEQKYWLGRMKDKPITDALKGAMAFQNAQGKSPKVLGAKSNNLYKMELSDKTEKSAPSELVTYSVKITNIYPENTILTPQLSITAKDLEIPTASDHGRRGKLANGKPGKTVDWNYIKSFDQKNRYEVKVDTKKSHTFIFQIKTPATLGSEYCIKAHLFPFLQDEDCNTVVKDTVKKIATTPTPKPTPAVKITAKDFRILTPDGLSTDRADQEITWYSSTALQKKYPGVKIELCPGKDFKGCIILEAIAENDGSQIINMPPVPRIGKWYLHIIGRDSNDGLAPNVSVARLVTLHQ